MNNFVVVNAPTLAQIVHLALFAELNIESNYLLFMPFFVLL